MIYLLSLALFVFAYVAWQRLETAVLLLVVLLPTYLLRFYIGIPVTFLEVMIIIVFAVWLLQNRLFLMERWHGLVKGRLLPEKKQYPFHNAMIAWLLVSFAAVGIADWSTAALGIWRAYFFEPLLLFIVIINIFNTKEKISRLISALGVSVIGVSILAWYQYITGQLIPNDFWASSSNRRATSFFPYPNAVGLYVAPIIVLLVGQAKYLWRSGVSLVAGKWHYLVSVLGIILGLGAILAAKSEGAAFGLVICLLLFGLVANTKTRLLSLVVIIVGVIGLYINQPLQMYVMDRLTLHNFSGQVRRFQWKETLMMLNDGNLITGAGLAGYQTAVAPFHQEGFFVRDYRDPNFQQKVVSSAEFRDQVWQPLEIYLYPHNIILNFWSETGLAGVIVFLWLIVSFYIYGIWSYRQTLKHKDPFAYLILGLMLSLAVSLIHGIVDVPYFKNDLSALFWIIMAMMGIIHIQSLYKEI